MTKRWITNPRDRRTKKYRDIHQQLKREVQQDRYTPRPVRHKIASEAFRRTGA